jgi:hypothetical protein
MVATHGLRYSGEYGSHPVPRDFRTWSLEKCTDLVLTIHGVAMLFQRANALQVLVNGREFSNFWCCTFDYVVYLLLFINNVVVRCWEEFL